MLGHWNQVPIAKLYRTAHSQLLSDACRPTEFHLAKTCVVSVSVEAALNDDACSVSPNHDHATAARAIDCIADEDGREIGRRTVEGHGSDWSRGFHAKCFEQAFYV